MKHSNKENISGFINFVVDISIDVDEESRHTRSNIGKVKKWKLITLWFMIVISVMKNSITMEVFIDLVLKMKNTYCSANVNRYRDNAKG